MSFDANVTITGIQEAQRANLRIIRAMAQNGTGMTRALALAGAELHRYAVAVTHVDTGALRASHRLRELPGKIELLIDPGSVNPRSHVRPAEYGLIEHDRGGEHAFYQRTYSERGPEAVRRAAAYLRSIID